MKKLTVDKGLLRETEAAQDQIRALLRCDFFSGETENDITLTAFRFLILDLINLYYVMNEGTVNVIEHFLEMSKPDAERAVAIYKTFVKQTERVVNYLSMARHYEHQTRLEIPKMKHAPTNLIGSMEDYIKDPEFETNRRQYLAEQQNKKNGGSSSKSASKPVFTLAKPAAPAQSTPTAFPDAKPLAASSTTIAPQNKGDLIDFFESIETNQQPMAQGQYQPQQQQFPQQMQYGAPMQMPAPTGTNPFLQMQQQPQPQMQMPQQIAPQYTGAGFGGYTPQPQSMHGNGFSPSLGSIPQSSIAEFGQSPQQSFSPQQIQPQQTAANPFRTSVLQQQQTGANPFRASMMQQQTGTTASSMQSMPTGMSNSTYPSSVTSQSTNPFAKSPDLSLQPPAGFSVPQATGFQQNPSQMSPFSPQGDQQSPFAAQNSSFSQGPAAAPLVAAPTGTNPFAKAAPAPFAPGPAVTTHATGTTNPFSNSQFMNQQTGQGWQNSPQGMIGGMSSDQYATTSIFPRPGQTNQQQQPMQQGWPSG